MRFVVFSSVILTFLVCPQTSIAFESGNQLRCLYSQPTTKQNIDVNVVECTYAPTIELLQLTDSLRLYPAVSWGEVATPSDKGVLLGGGAGLNYEPVEKMNAFFEGGGYWLADTRYGKRGEAYKNYGGNSQFFAKLGLNYRLYRNWMFGYAYLHISNGNRYETNPSFDGHSFTFGFRF